MALDQEILFTKNALLESSLYNPIDIPYPTYNYLIVLKLFAGPLDAFCLDCKKESIFHRVVELPTINRGPGNPQSQADDLQDVLKAGTVNFLDEKYQTWMPGTLEDFGKSLKELNINFTCNRNNNHKIYFHFVVDNSKLIKYGQYPSVADLQIDNTEKYRKVLSVNQYKEFKRAIGLSAHGIGIGSFVYLRRIFENLIEEAHKTSLEATDWDENKYQQSSMGGRIILLQDSLPKFLVDNRSVYSILSKGIHQLDETECLDYFEPVKTGIELILDEKIEKEEKEKKIADVSKTINRITGQLK